MHIQYIHGPNDSNVIRDFFDSALGVDQHKPTKTNKLDLGVTTASLRDPDVAVLQNIARP